MGFTKNKAFVIIITAIIFVIFNLFFFLMPAVHTIIFWLAYIFTALSLFLLMSSALLVFGQKGVNNKFLSLPSVNIAWIYFVLQTGFSVWMITHPLFPYHTAVILNAALFGLFLILVIAAAAGKNEVTKSDRQISQKIEYIRNLQTEIGLLKTADHDLLTAIENLAESIRFSDPMSHSKLDDVENTIKNKVDDLKHEINNIKTAMTICDEIQLLLQERNAKLGRLKDVPDERADDSGIKVLFVALLFANAAVFIIVAAVFWIMPLNKYEKAMTLYDNGHYEQAISAFQNLGNFKDSPEKIETVKNAVTENAKEIEYAKTEADYQKASDEYKNGRYINAAELFASLGAYKDSKDKLERIQNMFADGNEIYFGSYNFEPVEWIILENKKTKMLLLAKEPVILAPIHQDIKNTDWENSSIKNWLNDDFISGFSDEQKSKIIEADGIFLLGEKEYDKYNETAGFLIATEWWLKDKANDGFMFVGADGLINQQGDKAIRAKGIRPALWISLE